MPQVPHYGKLPLRNRGREERQCRITLSVVDAVGACESLIGVAFRLASHRVQFVALAQQGHPVEVVAPEVLLGYTVGKVCPVNFFVIHER